MSQIPGVHQRSVWVSKYIEQSTIRLIISTTKNPYDSIEADSGDHIISNGQNQEIVKQSTLLF